MSASAVALEAAWDLVHVALGRVPADLVLTQCRIVNVYSGELHAADIAIKGGRIAAIRPDFAHPALERIDARGAFVAPSLVEWTEGAILPGTRVSACTQVDQVIASLRGGRIPVLEATPATLDVLRVLRSERIDFSRACVRRAAGDGAPAFGSFLAGALQMGLTRAEVSALTSLNPSILCGLDYCIGSVTPGREAGFFLTTAVGSPEPDLVIVEGRVVEGSSFPVRGV